MHNFSESRPASGSPFLTLRFGFSHRTFLTEIDFTAPLGYSRDVENIFMIRSPNPEVVPLAADAGGVIRIGYTRVTLDTVIAAFAGSGMPQGSRCAAHTEPP